jgi:guanylate kinase
MSVNTFSLEIREPNYMPRPETVEQLQGVTSVPLIGPMLVGKTTVVQQLHANFEGFTSSQGFTTRDEREGGEPEYRFFPHTQETIDELKDKARHGELIHFHMHPTTGFVYGSEPEDYKPPYAVAATMASAVESLYKLPFKEIIPISLVCEPAEYSHRLQYRTMDGGECKKRITEGIRSLEWSLEQGTEMTWVASEAARLPGTAQEIANIVRGDSQPTRLPRSIGQRLLKSLRELV